MDKKKIVHQLDTPYSTARWYAAHIEQPFPVHQCQLMESTGRISRPMTRKQHWSFSARELAPDARLIMSCPSLLDSFWQILS